MAKPAARIAPLLSLKDVRLADGPVMLFDGVDMALEPRVRACLVGRNGAGKSTLLRLAAGRIEPDGGERAVQPAAVIAYVPQEPVITGDTLADYCSSADAFCPAADRWAGEAWLHTFGLDPARGTGGMSGGEVRRAALARAFAVDPDLLLLDEPTNHLDIAAIETLEAELKGLRAAALIVSHDRAFLERTTARCFWLAHRKVRRLDEGFAAFAPWADKMEAEEAEQLRRLEKAIERETYTFYRSITAQRTRNEGRARLLEDMRRQRAEAIRDLPAKLAMSIDAGATGGKRVIEARGLTKGFGERTLVKGFSTRILRGDRVAIVGPNGAGKTTLVKLLLGRIDPDAGEVKLGTGLEVGYLDQSRDALKNEMSLWDALTPEGGDQVMVRGRPVHVAAYARDFLFKDSQLRQPVGSLSGGERNRLLLARQLANTANLLVLDEPTNDLDMETLDLLEDMLAEFDGTLLLVSHDRDFIDRLATSTIALDGRGRTVETPGGWSDFLRQNPGFLAAGEVTAPVKAKAASPAAAAPAAVPAAARKLSFKDQHRLKTLEADLARLPAEIARLDARMAEPDLYTRDPKAFDAAARAADAARTSLAAAEDEWLALEEKREALEG